MTSRCVGNTLITEDATSSRMNPETSSENEIKQKTFEPQHHQISTTTNDEQSSDALADSLVSSLADVAASFSTKEQNNFTSRIRPSSSSQSGSESTSSNVEAAHVTATSATATSTTNSSSGNNSSSNNNNNSSSSGESKKADGFGLPVSNDDVRKSEHATVVAHLPPPESSSSGGESEDRLLIPPRREPGFQTIRRTFDRVHRRGKNKSSETDSSLEQQRQHHSHRGSKVRSARRQAREENVDRSSATSMSAKRRKPRGDETGSEENGGSSGSGTEGGYDGSASSNDPVGERGSCSSPSVSSSEASQRRRHSHRASLHHLSGNPHREMLSVKQDSSLSSEIADFSSESANTNDSSSLQVRPDSSSSATNSITSNDEGSSDDQGDRQPSHQTKEWVSLPRYMDQPRHRKRKAEDFGIMSSKSSSTVKAPIMTIGRDVMAHVLTFLEPPDILTVLTAPLSRDWLVNYTRQPELWRVLCLLEPFKAHVEDDNHTSDDDSIPSYPFDVEKQLRGTFGKYRILYTSFVRCMRYLARIKDDAIHGRTPTTHPLEAKLPAGSHNFSANRNLQDFLARARSIVKSAETNLPGSDISDDDDCNPLAKKIAHGQPIGFSDEGSATGPPTKRRKKSGKKKIKFAHSKLTERLLGPTDSENVNGMNLPWSCAIFSISNWMVAFADVEGIQTMCLKVLPFILEHEQHRVTAQRAGLTDLVLRAMVIFPKSVQLHTAAFHTIVLLARPLGGHEGMLFHTSMVNASGIFARVDEQNGNGNNGIAVMLDSMKRFLPDQNLQAMSCWSLVNIALVPSQKEVLVQLGGIEATANAMMEHPYNPEVQFRGLFALINLVIPSVSLGANEGGDDEEEVQEDPDDSQREMLDDMVDQVVHLVVLSMKNFCSSEAILNRACLVLHNLSLTSDYHRALLWTPYCFQMLEWCLRNYPMDQVLQQSASGTIHRLQLTLSNDEGLRARFAASLQAQQQLSLEQAHREAIYLRDQQQAAQQQQQRQQSHSVLR